MNEYPSAVSPFGSPPICRWFLDVYSEYRDHQLDPTARTRALAHLDSCSSCRRYDRVIRTGVAVLLESEAQNLIGTSESLSGEYGARCISKR